MAFKQPWNYSKNCSYSSSSNSSSEGPNWKWWKYSVNYLSRNQRLLREFFKSEGVWHFVDPQEPSILKAYDPTRPNYVPENDVWNKPKPNIKEELMEFEHEIIHELEVKKAQNLELVESSLNPWLTHPELTNMYAFSPANSVSWSLSCFTMAWVALVAFHRNNGSWEFNSRSNQTGTVNCSLTFCCEISDMFAQIVKNSFCLSSFNL